MRWLQLQMAPVRKFRRVSLDNYDGMHNLAKHIAGWLQSKDFGTEIKFGREIHQHLSNSYIQLVTSMLRMYEISFTLCWEYPARLIG
jgi:hypothetical protein